MDSASQRTLVLPLRALALPAGGMALLVLGMTLPLVRVESFWWLEQSRSLLGSVLAMAGNGDLGLALVILLFSVVLPVGKLLLITIDNRWLSPRAFQLLGKWSMLDIFVVAGVIAAIRFEALGEARAGPAIPLFVAGLAVTAWMAHQRSGHQSLTVSRSRGFGLLALALFAGGLIVPVLRLEKWGWLSNEVGVLTAIPDLLSAGAWLLATLMVLFVVLAPMVALLARLGLPLPGKLGGIADEWQMLGVFVAAIGVFGIKLQGDGAGGIGPGWLLLLAAWLLMLLSPGRVREGRSKSL